MRKIFLVAQREYLQNVKTKGFWFGILFFPFLLTAFIVVPQLLERTKSARRYAVVDQSGWLLDVVDARIGATDLSRVLGTAVERYREDSDELAELPAVLQAVAPLLADLAPAREWEYARHVLMGEALDGFSDEAVRALGAQAAALRAWWEALPASEARAITSSVTTSRYLRVATPAGDDPIPQLNRLVSDEEIFAYLVIGADPLTGSEGSRYVSNNLTDEDLRDWFSSMASREVRARRLEQERIDPEVAQWIQAPVQFEMRKVSAEGEEEEISERDTLRQWAPVVFVYLLWISVFSVSQMLMMNTVEEKSSRVIEVLLSSVSPIQLLAGKIAGIATTGLTMVGSWLVVFYLGTKFLPRMLGAPPSLDLATLATDPVYILSFLAYFMLGYLLYAAILVGLGSVCNTVSDAQNMMPAIMLFLFVPLLTMVPIGRDPNGMLAQILSYIPPFTPFVMMNRAAGPPTIFEYVATTALLAVSIVAALWVGAKIFRIGILLTGKPPKIREILRWIRAPVGLVPVRKEN
jgi:ABC-2 type transport system permease protein